MLADEKVREWKVQDGVGTESDRDKRVGRHQAQGVKKKVQRTVRAQRTQGADASHPDASYVRPE